MRRTSTGERGFTAVMVALCFSALLVVAAFGVDIGQAYADRRLDQNAVDTAVMSGAVESTVAGGSYSEVIPEIRAKVDAALDRTVSDADWLACSDPDQLWHTAKELAMIRSDVPLATDCISWTADFLEIRVRLPKQESTGVFAPMLGLGRIRTDAAANAGINEPGIGAPPFIALSTALAGDFVCLRTSSNPEPLNLMQGNGPGVAPTPSATNADPCNSGVYPTSSENFGTLKPYRYLGGCTQQNADVEVGVSIGIDHNMVAYEDGVYTPGDPEQVDGSANCTEMSPNTFYTDEGFNAQGLRCALISLTNSTDCNSVVPRLQQGDHVQTSYRFADEAMDNATPWQFLRSAQEFFDEGAPIECVAVAASRPSDSFNLPTADPSYARYSGHHDSAWDHYDRFDAFTSCLANWGDSYEGVLFLEDIAMSSRFAFIPQVYEASITTPKVHITGFMPMFLYRLYQATSGNGNLPCDSLDPRLNVPFFTHDAGQKFSCGRSNANVDRVASIIMACGMMPDTLCDKEEEGEPLPQVGRDFWQIRLTE